MNPYALFDLHCDTLIALSPGQSWKELKQRLIAGEPVSALLAGRPELDTLDLPDKQFSLSQIPRGVHWAQCCAIFVPDELRGQNAIDFYKFHRDSFRRQMAAYSGRAAQCRSQADIERAWDEGKTACILTIESAAPLAGRLERVEELARDGVRMITLAWNGENEVASGNVTDHGLSDFGREAVREMERQGIIVDVSHLNDRGFADLLEVAEKPFAASHSNARSACGHLRNLTDGQIREMVERKCLIGLNYSKGFLKDGGQDVVMEDLFRHVARFLELGAEQALALGSDFDGTDVPPCLDSMEKVAGLYGYFLQRGLSPGLADQIMWKNAVDFFHCN